MCCLGKQARVTVVIFNSWIVNALQVRRSTLQTVVKDLWENLKQAGLRQYRMIPRRCMA